MLSATLWVTMMEMGHRNSRGASIQSRISPNRELGCAEPGLPSAAASPPRHRQLGRRIRLFQAVAQAPYGDDAHAAVLDLLTQAVHVDLDGVAGDFLAPAAQ